MGNAASPRSDRATLSGRVIEGRYRIEQALGSGAVGTVYGATDLQTGRRAAVKLWHGTADQGQARARFVREAKALDTLRHPNIVEVFGAGIIDDLPYVAMEFLQGTTLEDELVPDQGMNPVVAFSIMRQVLDALAYAHGQNVVHRDLKPENIFLVKGSDGQPQVKLLDYGLAKFLGAGDDPLGGAAITVTGMVLGTPLYMPPEQAAGGKVDLRADVYAAGCILFEMLSGRLPFLGNDYGQLVRAHITAPIPNLAEVRPDCWVAMELQTLFATSMAKNANDRYPNGSQMLTALDMIPRPAMRPKKQPKPASPMAATSSSFDSTQRRSLIIGAAAAVLLILAGAIVVLLR